MQYITIGLYVFLSVAGIVCFKLGSLEALNMTMSHTYFSVKISWLSILGLMLYVVSFLVYMGLISKNNLSYLLPVVTGAVYILTLLSSVIVFKEEIHGIQMSGIVLILVGLILVNLKTK